MNKTGIHSKNLSTQIETNSNFKTGLKINEISKKIDRYPDAVYKTLKRLKEHNFVKQIDCLYFFNPKSKNEIILVKVRCPKCQTEKEIDYSQSTIICPNKNCLTKNQKRTRFTNLKNITKYSTEDIFKIQNIAISMPKTFTKSQMWLKVSDRMSINYKSFCVVVDNLLANNILSCNSGKLCSNIKSKNLPPDPPPYQEKEQQINVKH